MSRTLGRRAYDHKARKLWMRLTASSLTHMTPRECANELRRELANYPLKPLLHKGRKP